MKILTLDAGRQTGYAAFDDDALIDSGAVREDEIPFLARGKRELFRPDLVVMELTKPHYGKLGDELQRIQRAWAHQFPHLLTIQPYEWKPSHAKAKLPKHCSTTHERDAIRMNLWVQQHLDRFPHLPEG